MGACNAKPGPVTRQQQQHKTYPRPATHNHVDPHPVKPHRVRIITGSTPTPADDEVAKDFDGTDAVTHRRTSKDENFVMQLKTKQDSPTGTINNSDPCTPSSTSALQTELIVFPDRILPVYPSVDGGFGRSLENFERDDNALSTTLQQLCDVEWKADICTNELTLRHVIDVLVALANNGANVRIVLGKDSVIPNPALDPRSVSPKKSGDSPLGGCSKSGTSPPADNRDERHPSSAGGETPCVSSRDYAQNASQTATPRMMNSSRNEGAGSDGTGSGLSNRGISPEPSDSSRDNETVPATVSVVKYLRSANIDTRVWRGQGKFEHQFVVLDNVTVFLGPFSWMDGTPVTEHSSLVVAKARKAAERYHHEFSQCWRLSDPAGDLFCNNARSGAARVERAATLSAKFLFFPDWPASSDGSKVLKHDTALSSVLKLFGSAHGSLDIAVPELHEDEIKEAIIEAARRQVKVRILIDTARIGSFTVPADLPVKVKALDAMQHSFAILDNRTVAVGSFLWTVKSATTSYQNCMICRKDRLSQDFANVFNGLFRTATSLPASVVSDD